MKKEYYLDTCIWLNLFKKEGDKSKGTPYWEIASNFIRGIKDNDSKIYVSTIVLKELYHILENNFQNVMDYLESEDFIRIIKTKNEDYNLARRFEDEDNSKISFYDYLHTAIVKRLGCIFITRDKDLLNFSKNKIEVSLPEKLIG